MVVWDNGICAVTKRTTAELEQIKGATACPKGFSCTASGFSQAGRVRVLWGGELLECHEPGGHVCRFAQSFGDDLFCTCPLRKYLANVLRM